MKAKTKPIAVDVPQAEKPKLPRLDPLEAALETARNAQEGNRKLALSIDAMRDALETIVIAEVDNSTGMAISTRDLKAIASAALDKYSGLTGQSWRRTKLIGSYAGDRNLSTLEQ